MRSEPLFLAKQRKQQKQAAAGAELEEEEAKQPSEPALTESTETGMAVEKKDRNKVRALGEKEKLDIIINLRAAPGSAPSHHRC